jgi:hypothetical protein
VKEAISGNTVTSCPRNGGTSVNGPSAGDRLDRDVFGVAGLRYVVWLEGINDLGACLVSADEVIQGYKDVVERLHAKKIKVIGATVVSSFGSPIGSNGFPKIDVERKKINNFIRTEACLMPLQILTRQHWIRPPAPSKLPCSRTRRPEAPGSCCTPIGLATRRWPKPLTSVP